MKRILFIACMAVIGLSFSACNGGTKTMDAKKIEKKDLKQGKEYTSKYICPMHCEGSGSAEMGKCPVCEMDYELNEDYKDSHKDHDHGSHEGHDHDGHDHDGHDHDSHEGHNH